MARSVDRAEAPALGRYVIGDEIAAGGMATVHLGRMLGPRGFVRTVAIKRLHAFYARDPEFVSMFLDEARMAARVQHPNVVSTLDVVSADDELFLVMEYVRGESLAELERLTASTDEEVPFDVAMGIISGVLCGLHAAHEATTDRGQSLAIVHRDVSPQNVLVGDDGVARVLDFGIAKAKFREQSTQDGRLKGKLRYIAPEQLQRDTVDRRCDVYAASIVLWEMLTGRRCFDTDDPRELFERILAGAIPPPRSVRPSLPEAIDAVVLRGAARRPEERFATALEMVEALEAVGAAATPRQIGAWVVAKAGRRIEERAAKVIELESSDDADADAMRDGTRLRRRAPSHLPTDVGVDEGKPEPFVVQPPRDVVPASRRGRHVMLGGAMAALALGALATCTMTATGDAATVHPATAVAPSAAAPAMIEPEAKAPSPLESAPLPPIAASTPAPRAAPPLPRSRNAKTGGECDTPYFVDADGHKQFKARCL